MVYSLGLRHKRLQSKFIIHHLLLQLLLLHLPVHLVHVLPLLPLLVQLLKLLHDGLLEPGVGGAVLVGVLLHLPGR